jgi:hypothetical protein
MNAVPTPIADMITEMLKNCIPLDMIIVAVRSMERAVSTRNPVDETAEKRRAWDRDYRQKRRLERPPDPPVSTRHPPDFHPTSAEGALSLSSSSLLSGEPLKKVRSTENARARGHKLPPDWKPKIKHYDEGGKRGMTVAMVDERAVSMREWCDANANRAVTTKANWDSAFMGTWIKGSNNGNRTHQNRNSPPGPAPTGDDAVVTGMARALERRRAARGANDPGRQEFRAGGGDGAAAGNAAEPGTAAGDGGPHRQLALLPGGNGRE